MALTCHKLQSISAMRVVAAVAGFEDARIEIDGAALGEGIARAGSAIRTTALAEV